MSVGYAGGGARLPVASRADLAAALAHPATSVTDHYIRIQTAEWRARCAADLRLRAALADADEQRRAVELGIWREYHGATCRSASSLALAIFVQEGLDLDDAIHALGPAGDDAWWLVGRGFGRSARRAKGRGGGFAWAPRAVDDRERFLHSGHVVERWPEDRRALGVRISEHGLEVGFGVGELLVRTFGDEAVLFVGTPVPETVKAALPGRPVRDLIDHPFLRSPALVVTGVDVEAPPIPLGRTHSR